MDVQEYGFKRRRGTVLLYLHVLLPLFLFGDSASGLIGTNFTFGDGFSGVDELLLVEDAEYNGTTKSVLLTANSTRTQGEFACGMLFYHEPVAIREASFSTSFTFTIRSPYHAWGDGFAFTFREDAATPGSAGEYLCLLSSKTDMNPANHVFAVEFDTFKNDYDPSNNHIGVDVHAIESVSTDNFCGGVNCTYLVNEGAFTAWIDYDSPRQLLEVRIRNGSLGVPRPATAAIVQTVDLSSTFTDSMYVGFVGATGLEFEVHEIMSWSFNSSFAPGDGRADRLNATEKLALGLSIPLAAMALLSFLGCALVLHRLLKQSSAFRALEQELARQQVQPCLYSYTDIKSATRDFHPSNKLGQGGFGIVYKGTLADGTRIAAKKLLRSRHAEGFLNEVVLITGIRHRNLVKLRGCCLKDKQQILVYEYVENRNLAEALWDPGNSYVLDWATRFKICEGVARGLTYLHQDSQPRIIHRDIKATNILLDKEWKAKIADFGLARLFPDGQSHLSTMHIAGTMGYMAPEYATRGQLTDKADVYSFGVLMLEVISGRKNIDFSAAPPERVYLLEWAWNCYEENCLFELLDGRLSLDHVSVPEVHRALMAAMFCIQPSPRRRPSMSSVLAMLLGEEKLEVVMRLPRISTGEHAKVLAEINLSSPFATRLLHLKSVPESTPGTSNVLDVSEFQAR